MVKLRQMAVESAERAEKVYEVSGWHDEKALLKSLHGKLRWKIMNVITSGKPQGERGLDVLRLFPEIAIDCVFDPETGEKVFERKDKPMLEAMRFNVQQELLDQITDLSGLSEEALEEAKED